MHIYVQESPGILLVYNKKNYTGHITNHCIDHVQHITNNYIYGNLLHSDTLHVQLINAQNNLHDDLDYLYDIRTYSTQYSDVHKLYIHTMLL
jgi:hypothetical protein